MSETSKDPCQKPDPIDLVPDEVLLEQLRPMLATRSIGPEFKLLTRTPNVYASSCPSEIVHLGNAEGGSLELFCKYDFMNPEGHLAHRRGIVYEARVYREILSPMAVTVPGYFGCFAIPGQTHHCCLVVEALKTPLRVNKAGANQLVEAASWIGDFHGKASGIVGEERCSFLILYEEDRMRSYMERVRIRARAEAIDWIEITAERFQAQMEEIGIGPRTIIHGEFYPKNILVSQTVVYPIDWESAGLGAGGIDLASLTLGWPKQLVEECIQAYSKHRWSGRHTNGFRASVQLSAVYLCLRMFIEYDPEVNRALPPKLLDFFRQAALDNDFLRPGEIESDVD